MTDDTTLQPIDDETIVSGKPRLRGLDLSDPALVLLAELDPAVEDIATTLVEHGIPEVRAWALQQRVEGILRSKKRKAEQLLTTMKEGPKQPKLIKQGNLEGNRRQRRAMIAQGKKKRAHRERAIKRRLAGERKRAQKREVKNVGS